MPLVASDPVHLTSSGTLCAFTGALWFCSETAGAVEMVGAVLSILTVVAWTEFVLYQLSVAW